VELLHPKLNGDFVREAAEFWLGKLALYLITGFWECWWKFKWGWLATPFYFSEIWWILFIQIWLLCT
jgi:hypothetical protein